MKSSTKMFLKACGLLLVVVALGDAASNIYRSFQISKQLAAIPLVDQSQFAECVQNHKACQFELITDSNPALASQNFSVIKVFEEGLWHYGRSITTEWHLRKEAPEVLTLFTSKGHSKVFVSVSDLDTEYLSALGSAFDWHYEDSPLVKSIVSTLPKDDRVFRKKPHERFFAIKGLKLKQHVTAIGTLEQVGDDFWLRPFKIEASDTLQPVILSTLNSERLTKYLKDTLRVGDAQDEESKANEDDYYASEPKI